ncbi:response regulator [Pseudoalteromonas sp. B193]
MPTKIYSKAKILIVEEQPLAQSYMKQSLERLGFRQLRFADHANSAKEQCLSEEFDPIVCSFNLNKHQDGYQLYEELRVKQLIKVRLALFLSQQKQVAHSFIVFLSCSQMTF